jgi:formyltetrahydrofolate-dependent phosphoribosylglycinamide formyltransferase
LKIAVFVSGRGSNLQAILESEFTRNLVKIKAVISNKPNCPAFQIANKNSVPTYIVGNLPGKINFSELANTLKTLDIELIVLAGFLKLIPTEFIKIFQNKIINIHPALLPSYGGKGMYGLNVHKAVFNVGDKFSGPTIHFVDETYDTGKIIAQKKIDISNCKNAEEVATEVLKAEHKLLPFVLGKFAAGIKKLSDEEIDNL